MKHKKWLFSLVALVLLLSIPVFSLASSAYGSFAVKEGQTYTLEQMLTYAIQDEYMAKAEYEAILNAYGTGTPFTNILKAENTHISALTALFETYGISVPGNMAEAALPPSLADAYQAGITAENANIAMYNTFLNQGSLPEDVTATFTALRNASQSHLAAYTQNAEKTGPGLGSQNGRGGSNRAQQVQNSDDCPLGEDCLMNSTQNGRQNRPGNGRNGRR